MKVFNLQINLNNQNIESKIFYNQNEREKYISKLKKENRLYEFTEWESENKSDSIVCPYCSKFIEPKKRDFKCLSCKNKILARKDFFGNMNYMKQEDEKDFLQKQEENIFTSKYPERKKQMELNIQQALENNGNYFRITVHNTSCEQCRKYEGLIFSIRKEKDHVFPFFEDEHKPPYCKTCRHHALGTYLSSKDEEFVINLRKKELNEIDIIKELEKFKK